MFGKGVKRDKKKGIKMYKKCGKIGDDELGWIRKLSNDRYVCGEELNLYSLFLLFIPVKFICFYLRMNYGFGIGDSEVSGIGEMLKVNSTLTTLNLSIEGLIMYD